MAGMEDVYKNIDDYNPSRKRKRKILILFDDIIVDIDDCWYMIPHN